MVAKSRNRRVMGVDIGNGKAKIYTAVATGEKDERENDIYKGYAILAPSVYAREDEIGSHVIETEATKKQAENQKLDRFVIDGVPYLWGPDVARLNSTIASYGMDNRYTNSAYRTMVRLALAKAFYYYSKELGWKPSDPVLVITGVPTEDIDDKFGKSQTTKVLEDLFKGTGSAEVNGQEVSWNIDKIGIFPQPEGTAAKYWMDNGGYVIEDAEGDHSALNHAVIDVGSGTTDIDINEGVIRVAHVTLRQGFHDVYQAIRNEIARVAGIQDASFATDDRLLELLEEGKYVYSVPSYPKPIMFKDAMDEAVDNLASATARSFDEIQKSSTNLQHIFLTGGPAERIFEQFKQTMPRIEKEDEHELSDVIGFYRIGMQVPE